MSRNYPTLATIHTTHRHPATGRPLVISRGIGGGSGPWLVFEVRPNGSLRRVASSALPGRENPEETLHDLDEWANSRHRRAKRARD